MRKSFSLGLKMEAISLANNTKNAFIILFLALSSLYLANQMKVLTTQNEFQITFSRSVCFLYFDIVLRPTFKLFLLTTQ